MEVQSRRGRQKVILTPSVFRAGGERVLICRMTTADDVKAKHDDLSVNLGILFDKGADAVLFTDHHGVIQSCNDSFLDLIDAAHLVDIKGRNLSEFLVRGQIDMSVLIENARRSGQMRMYSTKLLNDFGSKTAIEMSATYLNDRTEPELGFMIRDASRVDAMRKSPMQGSRGFEPQRDGTGRLGDAQGDRVRDHRCRREDVHRDRGAASPATTASPPPRCWACRGRAST